MSIIKSENLITKSNRLIEASYKLTNIEQKIILTLISLVQPDDKDFQSYTFSIKDFLKLIGGNSITRYRELEDITKGLMSKVNEIHIEDRMIQVQWLSSAEYNYRKGTINLTLHPFLRPYLLELKKEFTSYQLKNVSYLKSSYSIRIYELLKQFERLKTRTFTVEDLRLKLGATEIYPQYGNFKQRILNPSKKEINKNSDIEIDFEEIKKGRSVHKIKFYITSAAANIPLKQLPVFDVENESENDSDIQEIQQMARKQGLEISDKVIEHWLDYGIERVKEELEQLKYRDDIQNPIGFISYMLKNSDNNRIQEVDPVQKALQEFIKMNTPKKNAKRVELLPDWFIDNEAIKYLSQFLGDEEEAHAFWAMHRQEVLEEIQSRRKLVLV